MVDFSIQNAINIIAQAVCGGDLTVAGLLVMVGVFFISLAIMAAIKAPVTYSLVPLIPLAIMFGTMGVLDVTLSFLIIIITAIVVALEVRKVVTGD